MIQIKHISNDQDTYLYVFDALEAVHNKLINALNEFGFPADELDKIDVEFTDMDETYIYLKGKTVRAHIFVAYGKVNLVLETDIAQKELSEKLRKHFVFPK